MRHGKKINHLGRKTAHRHALLSNMASSLILNKRITTTVAKAKALRKYVEPLLTKAKDDTTHSRRTVFSYLQNKESVKTLFGEVASKIADRPGGYTRIIKMGDVRVGDNAEMCLIELVDFNTLYTKDGAVKKAKTRRSRKGKKAEGAEDAVEAPAAAASRPVGTEAKETEKKTKKAPAKPKKAKE
jgi:large subunit ribosomal protein L17